jgi:hypothetical protein
MFAVPNPEGARHEVCNFQVSVEQRPPVFPQWVRPGSCYERTSKVVQTSLDLHSGNKTGREPVRSGLTPAYKG